MTTIEATQAQFTETCTSHETYRNRVATVARSVASYLVSRFTLNGDHTTGKQTENPIFYHESYPIAGADIVLGDE